MSWTPPHTHTHTLTLSYIQERVDSVPATRRSFPGVYPGDHRIDKGWSIGRSHVLRVQDVRRIAPTVGGRVQEKAWESWGGRADSSGPVSYTHLDVYKRQVFTHFPGPKITELIEFSFPLLFVRPKSFNFSFPQYSLNFFYPWWQVVFLFSLFLVDPFHNSPWPVSYTHLLSVLSTC